MSDYRPPTCEGCRLNPASPTYNGNAGGFAYPTVAGRRLLSPEVVAARLIVIGYYPGAEEEAEGQCFVGPSGRRLNAALAWAGADERETLKINICNCRTVTAGRDGNLINRDPTAAEIRDCARRWLWPQLRLAKDATVLMLLGAEAYRTVCGSRWRHSQVRNNRLVVPEGLAGLGPRDYDE